MSALYPPMFRLRQTFERPQVTDIPGTVERELAGLNLGAKIKPGQTVAVTAGSRGIANIHLVVKAIVEHLKRLGAKPFIVPAMGSHGGGTAEGPARYPRRLWHHRGRFAVARSARSMETIVVCQAPEGFPVHFDQHASEADHVVVVGSCQAAHELRRRYRKRPDEDDAHRPGQAQRREDLSPRDSKLQLRSDRSQCRERSCLSVARSSPALAIVENGYDETALIKAVASDEFEAREKELLVIAKGWMPRLPFDEIDVLIVEEIGKNISGAGMDTNVIGRKYVGLPEGITEKPHVKRIIVRGLTEVTHGNACGLGIAEFCFTRAIDEMDRKITVINCLTGGHPEGAAHAVLFRYRPRVSRCGLVGHRPGRT